MVNITFSLEHFEYFLLILVRISTFLFAAPFFSQRGIPNQFKIGLACFVSIMLYGVLGYSPLAYSSVTGFAVLVMKEGITGLLIGFSANICSSIVLFAGNIVDMDIGLSMATEFNADLNSQVTISGNLYQYLVLLLLMVSGMHTYVLRAAADSFRLIPVGGVEFQWDNLLRVMTRYMGDMMTIGFRIYLPFFACIMILNCILGIMAKVAPQMNMFAVGMQMKVLVGMAVMLLTVFLLPSVSSFIENEMKDMVTLVIESMH